MTRPVGRRYRPELDGLRAVAVGLVVVHHALQPERFAGFVGVDVFFVLSGYLITGNLLRELDRTGRVRLATFYVRRLLRLYPALLAMLVVTVAAAPLLDSGFGYLARRAAVAGVYAGNVWMTATGHWLGPFTHTWSLALEEQYYLVWPLLLWAAVALRCPRAALATVVAALGVVTGVLTVAEFRFGTIGFPLQTTTCGLLVGSALALRPGPGAGARDGTDGTEAPDSRLGRAGVPVAVGLLALAAVAAFPFTTAVPDGAYVVAAIVLTAVLVAHTGAHPGGTTVRLLSWAPLVAVGRISYGIYLWHFPVLLAVHARVPDAPAWLRLLLVAGIGTGLAAVSFRVVELPFLRWKDRLGAGVPRRAPLRIRPYAPPIPTDHPPAGPAPEPAAGPGAGSAAEGPLTR